MKTAADGLFVKIHYTMKLPSGDIVGTSRGGMPLTFTIGKGEVVQGLELGVMGMQPGESRTLTIRPEVGFGQRNDALVTTVRQAELPEKATVGRMCQYMDDTGKTVNFMVTRLENDVATLDANHPLAGKTLLCDVVMLAIGDPAPGD